MSNSRAEQLKKFKGLLMICGRGSCNSKNVDPKLHSCPYNEEINGDNTPVCNCCDDCTQDCAMDI